MDINLQYCQFVAPDLVNCLSLGTGRFLRAVLVPALVGAGFRPALIQSRGRSFLDYMAERKEPWFEVDTVLSTGQVVTDNIACAGAFTMGTTEGKLAVVDFITKMKRINVIGTGFTEAGMSSKDTMGMKSLYQIFELFQQLLVLDKTIECTNPHGRICVINTDNVPSNGSVIKAHMIDLAKEIENQDMQDFLENHVTFLNSMVDRITSQREGSSGMIPRCEPVPTKALVILDYNGDLPLALATTSMKEKYGVVVRSVEKQLKDDIALKLRVANGTHTAVAHTLALCKFLKTDCLSTKKGTLLMSYLDTLFDSQILEGAMKDFGLDETTATYDNWRSRLCHPHFGLSSFFITQNGAAKGGIRLGPTVKSLLYQDQTISVSMAFAFAAILRWLTPSKSITASRENGMYQGWLDGSPRVNLRDSNEGISYADGLRYNLEEGWYEFRCACPVSKNDGSSLSISEWLGEFTTSQQPCTYVNAIKAYLTHADGGDMEDLALNARTKGAFENFVFAVATLYARMIAGNGLTAILQEISMGPTGFKADCIVLRDGASI